MDFFEDMMTGGKKHLSLLSLSTTKNLTKKYEKRLKIGLATGQAYAMCLIYRLVQKLTTNDSSDAATNKHNSRLERLQW